MVRDLGLCQTLTVCSVSNGGLSGWPAVLHKKRLRHALLKFLWIYLIMVCASGICYIPNHHQAIVLLFHVTEKMVTTTEFWTFKLITCPNIQVRPEIAVIIYFYIGCFVSTNYILSSGPQSFLHVEGKRICGIRLKQWSLFVVKIQNLHVTSRVLLFSSHTYLQ